MNWIILNGKRSTLIKGLIIRSLPPITKPLVRTSVETIDGRDGDIVTRLGYAAYDKTVEIGLAGNYDVDQVIKFFSAPKPLRSQVEVGTEEGEVIFSNEPDKYYRYAVYEAIDFERLLRFKTATVTFHVQPFKYSAADEEIEVSTSGSSGVVTLFNRGNIYSKPIITVLGSGTVNIMKYGAVGLNMTEQSMLTLNCQDANVYSIGGELANRCAIWEPKYLFMDVGSNSFSWSGTVSKFIIKDYSRWI